MISVAEFRHVARENGRVQLLSSHRIASPRRFLAIWSSNDRHARARQKSTRAGRKKWVERALLSQKTFRALARERQRERELFSRKHRPPGLDLFDAPPPPQTLGLLRALHPVWLRPAERPRPCGSEVENKNKSTLLPAKRRQSSVTLRFGYPLPLPSVLCLFRGRRHERASLRCGVRNCPSFPTPKHQTRAPPQKKKKLTPLPPTTAAADQLKNHIKPPLTTSRLRETQPVEERWNTPETPPASPVWLRRLASRWSQPARSRSAAGRSPCSPRSRRPPPFFVSFFGSSVHRRSIDHRTVFLFVFFFVDLGGVDRLRRAQQTITDRSGLAS